MRKMTSSFLLVLAIYVSILCHVYASAPALAPTPAEHPSDHHPQDRSATAPPVVTTCSSDTPQEAILCEANSRRDDIINQVKQEDQTVDLPEDPPPVRNADDVWVNAYNQWMANSKGSSGSTSEKADEARQRALKIAKQRHTNAEPQKASSDASKVVGEDHSTEINDTNHQGPIPVTTDNVLFSIDDEDNDELKLITAAADKLSSSTATTEEVRHALELACDLCASGDNGRQFSARGGINATLKLVTSSSSTSHNEDPADRTTLQTEALRTLATCAQNNRAVYDAAVANDGVRTVAQVGSESETGTRAAALLALVAMSDATTAREALWEARTEVCAVVKKALDEWERNGADVRRGIVRALALMDAVLRADAKRWIEVLEEVGAMWEARRLLESADVDIREGAARVVRHEGRR